MYKLNYGDTIAVVGVSGNLKDDKKDTFYQAKKLFEKNFKVKQGKFVFENFWGSAGTPEQKASDFMAMIQDKEVKCIICLTGGETCNTFIDLLDYQVIKNNPKIIVGYSDISVLLQAINSKTGLTTFSGSTWTNFGNENALENYKEFHSAFVNNCFDGFLKAPTKVIRQISHGDSVSGAITGTNLGSLMYLSGTPYMTNLLDSSIDKILFIESYKISTNEMYRRFTHLKQQGVFENIKAVVVGYNCNLDNYDVPKMEDVLLSCTSEYDFPIIKTNSFGHEMCNKTIPIGEVIEIDKDGNFKLI